MSLQGSILATIAVVAALGVAGCGDKSNEAKPDGGEVPQVPSPKDAGTEAGLSTVVDSGIEEADLAMPKPANEELAARMRHLLEAIAQNNADLAGDTLFPRDAYISSRDEADPQKAWEKRLSGAFKHAVERTHKRNKGVENAKFVGFELGHAIVQLTPKKRDFKRPLWRVKHSKLTFTVDGKNRHLDIAEMTAWRGAWYVTRLR